MARILDIREEYETRYHFWLFRFWLLKMTGEGMGPSGIISMHSIDSPSNADFRSFE
jgi:hypothetical protein